MQYAAIEKILLLKKIVSFVCIKSYNKNFYKNFTKIFNIIITFWIFYNKRNFILC